GFYSAALILFGLIGCQSGSNLPPSDKDNGGLYLPDGFEAVVVTDSIGGGPMPITDGQQRMRPPQQRSANANQPTRVRSNQGRPTRNRPRSNYYGSRHIAVNDNGDIYVKL